MAPGGLVAKKRTRRPPTRDFDPQPYLEHCGKVFQETREALDLSRAAVGEATGMTTAPIRQFETGESVRRGGAGLSLEQFLRQCDARNIPIVWPFTPKVPPELRETVDLLVNAPARLQRIVRDILLAMDPEAGADERDISRAKAECA